MSAFEFFYDQFLIYADTAILKCVVIMRNRDCGQNGDSDR